MMKEGGGGREVKDVHTVGLGVIILEEYNIEEW